MDHDWFPSFNFLSLFVAGQIVLNYSLMSALKYVDYYELASAKNAQTLVIHASDWLMSNVQYISILICSRTLITCAVKLQGM